MWSARLLAGHEPATGGTMTGKAEPHQSVLPLSI
jgi:hypothetical protein